jgi:S-adenosylmethionine-diacylglycerol 3-amino-3-carboxypropyl transferase
MGRLGRNPRFFDYVKGNVSERLFARAEHAFTELSPAVNPYLHWILHGCHNEALPFALREENFESIRAKLDNLELRQASVEEVVEESSTGFDCFNLSDIFEYMSETAYHALLDKLIARARPGARLAYWNMLAPRVRPESLAPQLKSQTELAERLHIEDKAFFYSRFVLEEVAS